MPFSTNQFRQFYVATALDASGVTESDVAGTISVHADNAEKHLYFKYMGKGGLVRSDLISVDKIAYAKAVDAKSLARKQKRVKVVLDSAVNAGSPVPGQDYLLRIYIRNYIGLSEEDQTCKYGMVHTYTGMTASDFYKTLALSLVKNFSREVSKLLKFYVETGGTSASTVGTLVEVTSATKASDLTGTYTGIVLEEAPQDWILGTFPQTPVNYTVTPDSIVSGGDERIWGIATEVAAANTIPNGKITADMEYFYMGERGDIYRGSGWPNIIHTEYMVNPSLEYNFIEIHFSQNGNNEAAQKSERDITIAVPKVGATQSAGVALVNSIVSAINNAAGLSIATLATS